MELVRTSFPILIVVSEGPTQRLCRSQTTYQTNRSFLGRARPRSFGQEPARSASFGRTSDSLSLRVLRTPSWMCCSRTKSAPANSALFRSIRIVRTTWLLLRTMTRRRMRRSTSTKTSISTRRSSHAYKDMGSWNTIVKMCRVVSTP